MTKIEFIPEKFADVVCEFGINRSNSCTPHKGGRIINEIKINAPEEIIYQIEQVDNSPNIQSINPKLPICIYSVITSRRGHKYHEMSDWVVRIKKVGDDEWYSGIVTKPVDPHDIANPNLKDYELLIQEKRKEAKKYSDSELNTGGAVASSYNFDLHEYIDIILDKGAYEVYLSKSGLESNHVIVKTTFKY